MEAATDKTELMTELWKKRLNDRPTNLELCCIIVGEKSLREEAWRMLLAQNPTKTELLCIAKRVESLRKEAEKLLRQWTAVH